MWSFPASFMAEFFANHGMYSLRDRPAWRTVSGGSIRYVEAIAAPWRHRVRLRAPVRRIERLPGRVRIEADGCETEEFDRGRDRGPLRPGAGDARRPERGRARAARRDPVPAQRGRPPHRRLADAAAPQPPGRAGTSTSPSGRHGGSTVTYWMNNLQRLSVDREYMVTLNRSEAIDPAKVLHGSSTTTPIYTAEGVAAQARKAEISGVRGTHYCGAYWGWGFHEDGVLSAIDACEGIGPRLLRGAAGGARGMTASAVYEGAIRHRRFEPVEHSFRYKLFLMYLDLDELPEVLDPYPLWSARRPRPGQLPAGRLHRRPAPAAGRVRARRGRVADRLPARGPGPDAGQPALPRPQLQPGLPLLLLRPGRRAGGCGDRRRQQHPLGGASSLRPGKRRARGNRPGRRARQEAPRLPADGDGADLRVPGQRAGPEAHGADRVAAARAEDGKTFEATLSLRRRELSAPLLAWVLARYPAMSMQVVAKIYLQALRLQLKGARVLPHPEGARPRSFISP